MTGLRDEPWWASGGDPVDGVDAADPLQAHREARAGDPAKDRRERDRREDQDPGADAHAHQARASHRHGSGDPACQACPVCMALRALDSSRPELIGHLSEALHHLSLAAKAFVDAQARQTSSTEDLERIDLDDADVAEDGVAEDD